MVEDFRPAAGHPGRGRDVRVSVPGGRVLGLGVVHGHLPVPHDTRSVALQGAPRVPRGRGVRPQPVTHTTQVAER